jgi:RNA-directed DNA polymerase
MLSNIVLNELDKELENRGLKFCRWADDFVILVKSERASVRVLNGITKFLEEKLLLPVNKEKSSATRISDITFLGFHIYRKMIRISNKGRKNFKEKVRMLTKRNNPLSMYNIIKELNKVLIGWVNYFRIQEFRKVFKELDGWLRSRLRSMQLKKWKKPKKFQRVMIKAGFAVSEAKRIWIRMNRFQSVHRKEVKFVLNLNWFRKMGLVFLDDYTNASLSST